MKDESVKNDHVLKLSGKAELPDALKIGNNYGITLQGTVTSITEIDKNDGSHVLYYKFEPIHIEVINEKGEAIKLKDTRSSSQLFRARLWTEWKNSKSDSTFDDWYGRLMQRMIRSAEEIASMYGE